MARKRKGDAINGIIILNKPKGLSSNQALQRVKRLFNAQKAGHTGSLDPMATGVLPICFGKSTRISQYLLDADKSYFATIQLGMTTDTGDTEGKIIEEKAAGKYTIEQIENVLALFRGDIQQIPPMFSALKSGGRPLYELAREGIEIKRTPRDISIYSLKLLNYSPEKSTIDIHVKCSKGTYIRTLGMDIARALDTAGHLSMLKRDACGLLNHLQMLSLDNIEALSPNERYASLISSEFPFTDKPIFTIPESEETTFYQTGKLMNTAELHGIIRLYNTNGFIGIAEFDHGHIHKKQLFPQGIIDND
ncbi:tRNA pseudouridine(55) synthase TruB [Fangia hongkongensis]|uniref:tRNA pseudouridine(55) synthase TruB n=1 Tax=Fangia hongkongensis TaxID=270495 RepID=UPI0003804EF2|nr:tRNA pseudouridine(55) synthase TruB [Fangia hongkongensis]MBK2125786.1 tRNA pseudouridine(55) synthase TruB [Fangia hongkongensis]